MHMYWSGFPTFVMGHPFSSVGSVHVAFWASVKRNTAGRALKQQDSQVKGKGYLGLTAQSVAYGRLDLVRNTDSQAHIRLSDSSVL